MTQFYVPPKDVSTLYQSEISSSVVGYLSTERTETQSSNSILYEPAGIASTATSQYQVVAKQLDLQMLDAIQTTIDLINQKKTEIVGLCAQAFVGYIAGVNPPACTLEPNKGNLSSSIVSEKGELPAVVGFTGGRSGITSPGTPQIAYGVIRDDNIRIRRYPYLEQRIAPNDNSLENMKFPILDTGNAGQGKENIFFKNSKYNDGVLTYYVSSNSGNWRDDDWSGNDNVIGRYYKITGPGSGTISIGGTFDAVTKVFNEDSLYSPIVSSFTGVVTGNYQPYPSGASVYVKWDPSTRELTPVVFGFIISGPGNFITTSGAACNTIATQISDLENEIETLRVGITTWFTATNVIKERKHHHQLRIWTYKRIETRGNTEIINVGIGTSAVVAVDPELPTTFITFDDNLSTKFDSTNLRFDNA